MKIAFIFYGKSTIVEQDYTILRKETEWYGLENDPMFNKPDACKNIVTTLKEAL